MNKLYNMPITKTWLGYYHKAKDFDKAKCPICKKEMTYEQSVMNIRFACENKKCIGYFRWLEHHLKTMNGDIEVSR